MSRALRFGLKGTEALDFQWFKAALVVFVFISDQRWKTE